MIAEVISIGDELTSGQRLDTNSQWLSLQLQGLGVQVVYHTTVADDLEAHRQVIQQAVTRADVVVMTGGLGPTADDLTRDVMAAAAGVSMILDEPSLEHIRRLFAQRRRREMPERNVVQAMFPEGSRPIFNPHGTAPGIEMEINSAGNLCQLFALPGVPAEMREMWQAVADAITRRGGTGQVIRHRVIKCFGIGESDLESMLPDLIRRGRQPSVGITVSGATISLRITASAATPEDCYAAMQPTVETIHHCLGELVFGEGEDELQEAVLRLLYERDKTLAVVEWGTGGQIAHWLREVPDAEDLFLGGVSLASREAATHLLGVPAEMLEQYPPGSGETASALAEHCRERFDADYALAVGRFPIINPQAQEPERVHFALAGRKEKIIKSAAFTGHPSILKIRAAKQALNLVRLTLLKEARG